MTVSAELAEIGQWWARRSGGTNGAPGDPIRSLAGGPHDQPLPAGVDNPYWEIVRQLPWVSDAAPGSVADSAADDVCPVRGGGPDGFARGLPVGHHLLTKRYSWAITSPGDLAWLARIVRGRGLVEIGAGSGYWAWQAAQARIDVVAYEPADPAVNPYTDGVEYFRLRRADHTAAARHPDRALMLCWPSSGEPWAARALDVYAGDLLIYIGEERGGRCAGEGFFRLLEQEWRPIGSSPHHVAWRHTTCTMTAFRRV